VTHRYGQNAAAGRDLSLPPPDWLGYPRALLFISGFAANQAVIAAMMGKEDRIVCAVVYPLTCPEPPLPTPNRSAPCCQARTMAGCWLGSGGSGHVSGYTTAHQALEEELADWLGYPRALLFPDAPWCIR
jgi:7-keto-8-aminopelargonate synthetase-like enzyme